MILAKLDCSPGREPCALTRALARHGAAVRIAPSVALLAPRMVYVRPSVRPPACLPDDEYREKKCREIVEE